MTHATIVRSILLMLGAALAAPVPQAGGGVRDAERAVRTLSAQEVDAFLRRDRQRLASLWSADFVVTNPLNRLANKEEVLGMVGFGFSVIQEFERGIEFARGDRDLGVLAGRGTVMWGGGMPGAGTREQLRFTANWGGVAGWLAADCAACERD